MQNETNPMNYMDDPLANNQIIPNNLLPINKQQHLNGAFIPPMMSNSQFQHPQQIKQPPLACYGKMPEVPPSFPGQNVIYNDNMQKGYYYNSPYRNDQMGMVRYNTSNYYPQHMISHPQQSQQMSLHCYNKQTMPPQHTFFHQRNMAFYPESNLNEQRFMNDQSNWNVPRGVYSGKMVKNSMEMGNFDPNFPKHGHEMDAYNYPVRYPGHMQQPHVPPHPQHIGNKYFIPQQQQMLAEPVVDARFYNKPTLQHQNELLKQQQGMHFDDNYYNPNAGSSSLANPQQSSAYLPGRRLEHFSHMDDLQQPTNSQHQQMFTSNVASSAYYPEGKGQSSVKGTLEYHHSDHHSHYDNSKPHNNNSNFGATNQTADHAKFVPGPNNFQQPCMPPPDKNIQSPLDANKQRTDQNICIMPKTDSAKVDPHISPLTTPSFHPNSSHPSQQNSMHCSTTSYSATALVATTSASCPTKDNNNNTYHHQHHHQQQQVKQQHSTSALSQQACKSICSTMKIPNQSKSSCSQSQNDNRNVSISNTIMSSLVKSCDNLNNSMMLMTATSKVKQPRKPRKKKTDIALNRTVVAGDYQINDKVVIVPYKWKRVIENKSVYYISPSRVRLESLKEIYQYLLTDGTCKCGLLCPLFIEQVFIFDWTVKSKHLTNEEACAKASSSASLCYHKKKMKLKIEGSGNNSLNLDDRSKSLNNPTFDDANKLWRQQLSGGSGSSAAASKHNPKHKEKRKSKLECSLIDTYKTTSNDNNTKRYLACNSINNNNNNNNNAFENINNNNKNNNDNDHDADKSSYGNHNYMHSISSSSSSSSSSSAVFNRMQMASLSSSQHALSPYDSDATKSASDINCSSNESCSSDEEEDVINRPNPIVLIDSNTNTSNILIDNNNNNNMNVHKPNLKHLQDQNAQLYHQHHHRHQQQPQNYNDDISNDEGSSLFHTLPQNPLPNDAPNSTAKSFLKSGQTELEQKGDLQTLCHPVNQMNPANSRNVSEDVQSVSCQLDNLPEPAQLRQTTCPIKLVENMVSELMTTKNSLAEVTTMMMSRMEGEKKKKLTENHGLEFSKSVTSSLITVENITSAKVAGSDNNDSNNVTKVGGGVVLTSNIYISSSSNNISTNVAAATTSNSATTFISGNKSTFSTLPSMNSALPSAFSFVGLKTATSITTTSLFSSGKLTAKTNSVSFSSTSSSSSTTGAESINRSASIATTSFLNDKYSNILNAGNKLSTLLNVEDINKISTATTIDEMFSDDDEDEENQTNTYNNPNDKDNIINIWLENNDKTCNDKENKEHKRDNDINNSSLNINKDSVMEMDVDDVVKTTGTQTSTPASNSTLEFVDNDGDSRETICCGSVENNLTNVSTSFDGITTGANPIFATSTLPAKTSEGNVCSLATNNTKTSTMVTNTQQDSTAISHALPSTTTSTTTTASAEDNRLVVSSKTSPSLTTTSITTSLTTAVATSQNETSNVNFKSSSSNAIEPPVQPKQQQVVVLPTQQSSTAILIPHQQQCNNLNFDNQLYQTAQANYLQSLGFGFAQGQVGLLHFATTPSSNQSLGLALGMGVNILNSNNVNSSNNTNINFGNININNCNNENIINNNSVNKIQLDENQNLLSKENNIPGNPSTAIQSNSAITTAETEVKPLTTNSVNANQLFQLVVSQGVQQAHHILVPNYSSFAPFAGAALVPVPVVQPNSMAFCNLVATANGPPTLFTVGQNPFGFMTAGPILVSEDGGGDKSSAVKKLKSPMYCHDAPDSTVDSEEVVIVGSGSCNNNNVNVNREYNNNNSNNNNNNNSAKNNNSFNNNNNNGNINNDSTNSPSKGNISNVGNVIDKDEKDDNSSSSSSSSSSLCIPTSTTTTANSEKCKTTSASENNSNSYDVINNKSLMSSSPIIICDDDDKQTTIMNYSTSSETDDNDDVMMTDLEHCNKLASIDDSSSQASETFTQQRGVVGDLHNRGCRNKRRNNDDDDERKNHGDAEDDRWSVKNNDKNKLRTKKLLKYAHSIKRRQTKNFTNLISNIKTSTLSRTKLYLNQDYPKDNKIDNKNDCKLVSMLASSSTYATKPTDKTSTSNDCLVTTSDASNNFSNSNNNNIVTHYDDNNNSVVLSVSNVKRLQRKKHEMRMKMMRKIKPESPISSDDTIDDADSTTTTTLPTTSPCNFNIGDLVWGPTRGFPSWPGKLVSEIEVKGNPKPECGKIWVKWFGDNTYAQADISQLKTLSEGLETHHNARKTHRKGRKMNAGLEAAIQEAMFELDKQMAKQTNNNNNDVSNVATTVVSKKSRR